jgi:N-acetyl-anhydromuramyl-L-alanine amidase AmpD
MAGVLRAKWIRAYDYRKGRTRPISAIVLHSTCGRKLGDIQTLTGEGGPVVSCHFYITRDGALFQFVEEADTAYHAGRVRKPEWSNAATIGVEMEHFDPDENHPRGEDWPEKQVKVCASLVAYLRQNYGDIATPSHAQIASPKGRKIDPHDFPWLLFSIMTRTAMLTKWTLEKF